MLLHRFCKSSTLQQSSCLHSDRRIIIFTEHHQFSWCTVLTVSIVNHDALNVFAMYLKYHLIKKLKHDDARNLAVVEVV